VEVYGNGTRQCKVWVTGLSLSDGAVLQLAVNGERFTELLVRSGRARYRRERERDEAGPDVAPNQLLQVFYGGQAVLEGQFYME
jgi:hypothetical protein